MREELGDLLFMTCFCCKILGETHPVTMHDIAREGNAKLVRRHPLVFGDQRSHDVTESQERWDRIKAEEKRARGIDPDEQSLLKDMPASTAPLHQAHNYQKDAARGVKAKLQEELEELEQATATGDATHIEHEVGDLLFTVVNLARWLDIQPDMALRKANRRFRDRFHLVEEDFTTRSADLKEASIDELEASWQEAKRRLSGGTDEAAREK